jgi:threonine dehydrogenase-like Zn-dependent dehydrogenase
MMHGAGDVRVEDVPDPVLRQPTDAVVRVLRACICGSDLWPYGSMAPPEQGRRIGHEFLAVVEDVGAEVSGLTTDDVAVAPFVWADNTCDFCRVGASQYPEVPMDFGVFLRNITLTGGVAPARAYIEELLPDVLDGAVQPGKVFDRTVDLDGVPDGYRAMADREALKALVRP